ncbi:hypothetical protein CH63R_13574 [Colletotrichum higginsianum IMI 349063]|uniref:Uncharacterized protein n=1 Tax=Colletotrichum higginsianum (strain IMI 349063) TaxID=759273 RepID=A0A1B7XRF1_COLHI|nr:hypothetical protein CH63R_13574 [Colletotrichum higginsianum IMI 349063]OBR02348.1 hypothetical protein CH63R_13574 [Colletotrichum higginsianum IMI 349063]
MRAVPLSSSFSSSGPPSPNIPAGDVKVGRDNGNLLGAPRSTNLPSPITSPNPFRAFGDPNDSLQHFAGRCIIVSFGSAACAAQSTDDPSAASQPAPDNGYEYVPRQRLTRHRLHHLAIRADGIPASPARAMRWPGPIQQALSPAQRVYHNLFRLHLSLMPIDVERGGGVSGGPELQSGIGTETPVSKSVFPGFALLSSVSYSAATTHYRYDIVADALSSAPETRP